MNRKQESKFGMGYGLRDLLNQNAAITSSIPEFGKYLTALIENMDEILVINEKQVSDQSGIARYKRQLKNDLFVKALDISRKTATYAKIANNTVLEDTVRFSESELKMANAQVLKDLSLLIHHKAEENLTALVPYGVTEEYLNAFKTAIDQFIEVIPKPRLGINDRKQATAKLVALFQENDKVLEKLDALVEVVRLSQPEFYASYRNVRRVIEQGKGTLSLTASVTDRETHSGIKGVRVSFACQEKLSDPVGSGNGRMLVKTTTEKGFFQVKSMLPGTWVATLVKPGYKEKTVTLQVFGNERTKLAVELERA